MPRNVLKPKSEKDYNEALGITNDFNLDANPNFFDDKYLSKGKPITNKIRSVGGFGDGKPCASDEQFREVRAGVYRKNYGKS